MHVRPMRFNIWCAPTDSSDKTHLMFFTIWLCLFYPNTILMEAGWTTAPCPATNVSILICKSSARTKRDYCCSQNTSRNKVGNLHVKNVTYASTRWLYWFHTKLSLHILQQNCAHAGMMYHNIVNTSISSFCFCESLPLGRECVQFK